MKGHVFLMAVLLLGFTTASGSDDVLNKYKHSHLALEEADVKHLIGLLGSPDPNVRAEAAGLIGVAFRKDFQSARQSIPKLIALVKMDENEYVRAIAAGALARSGDPSAVEHLIHVARHDTLSPILRAAALHELRLMGGRVEELAEIGASNLDSPNLDLRFESVLAVGSSKDTGKIQKLLRAYINHHEHPEETLMNTPAPGRYYNNAYDELSSLYSLCLFGVAAHTPDMLLPLLDHPNPRIRLDIAVALANRGTEEAVTALIHILKHHGDPDTRCTAAGALFSAHLAREDKRVIPELKELLKDKEPRVAKIAYSALRNLGVKVEKIGEGHQGPVEYRIVEE